MSKPCGSKHAKPQIPDAEWKCPECGITSEHDSGGFVIGDPTDCADDCELLHEEDGVYCYNCDYATSGKAFAKAVAKRRNLVPCGQCKGSGFVAAIASATGEEK